MSNLDHPTVPPHGLSDLFLKKLRHDLLNAARPVVEIPQWINEDLEEAQIDIPTALRENLDLLGICGRRLQHMLLDLLTYAHIGRHTQSEPIPITTVLAELTAELPKTFTLTQDIRHDTLPVPSQDMRTLLDGLLSNAVKHHDRAGGKIHVSCKKLGTTLQFSVADDGPGIDPSALTRIFDPLTTLASRDQVEGSGMGLAIARRIAELNGGHVKAISPAQNRGTCIAMWFV